MLSAEENERLTRVGRGTPMGDYLRRYWQPVAGVSELDETPTKPIQLMGEHLVLFRDGRGRFGLIDRHCPHRRADLSYGMIEPDGLRCNYHGWCFDREGRCISQPFEDRVRGGEGARNTLSTLAYPVEERGGLIWAYLGPLPAPLLPNWEVFDWPDRFVQVAIAEIPCNWLQCQENSIDPLHFEWMHDNWSRRLSGDMESRGPTHEKLRFAEFEYGFTYHRIREDSDEHHPLWTDGRVFLWPNCFYLGEHFEYRVPIDDENTLSILWKSVRVPSEQHPYVQTRVPTWHGPIVDDKGRWITSHVLNQDFLAWVGQGRIADRTQEKLTLGDQGIVMIRRRFLDEFCAVERGEEPKGTLRDPALNRDVKLPMADRESLRRPMRKAEMLADPFIRMTLRGFNLQAGQPAEVKAEFRDALGIADADF